MAFMGRDANGFADITRTSGSHKVGSVGILTNMAPANTMQLQRSLEVYRLRGHIHLLLGMSLRYRLDRSNSLNRAPRMRLDKIT